MTEDLSDKPKVRCAIYARKSSEDGLEQEFNSIDAQRLAGENFIASQVSKGWVLNEEQYNDGGFSGGNLDRPALQKLMQDIREGKINCVVVYKIDRLTRSLFDFQKIIEVFDKHKVSFVAVTQSFNTSDSMGRLMLNVLLSFAQYEREITGERIRDKVAASKQKGMWMGGTVPLGYDSKDGKLVINEKEELIVKNIFMLFLENESAMETARALNSLGYTTKTWTSRAGKIQMGKKFDKQHVRRTLQNPIYAGFIEHQNKLYDGQHIPIISKEVFEKAKIILTRNQQNRLILPKSRITMAPLLKGLVRCGVCGSHMVSSYTNKAGKRYRYYLCTAKALGKNDSCEIARISANEAENVVTSQIISLLKKPEFIVSAISQAENQISESKIINAFKHIETVWDELFPVEQARIVNLLVKEVEIRPDGINLKIFKGGLTSLTNELTS